MWCHCLPSIGNQVKQAKRIAKTMRALRIECLQDKEP